MCSESLSSPKPVLTPKEAAEYLKISPKTLDHLRRQGKIAAVAILGDRRKRYRYRIEELNDFLSRDVVQSQSANTPFHLQQGDGKWLNK